MREIKFRTWLISEKRMACIAGLDFGNPIKIEVPRMGKENVCGRAWDNPNNFEFWYEGKEAILMQYTGLEDKNGKEIYEGDLIQNEDGRICEVRWHQKSGQWDSFVRKTIKHDSSNGFSPEEWWHCIEAIGNIHENPELLERK